MQKLDKAIPKTTDDANAELNRAKTNANNNDLTYCNIWVGRTEGSDEPSQAIKESDADWNRIASDKGIVVIYLPLLPNEDACPGLDPEKSAFMSTWNFEYTEPQIDQVLSLAQANFDYGESRIKRAVRAVYERKKQHREGEYIE